MFLLGVDYDEAKLLKDILGEYNKKLRPVIKKEHNVTVKLGLTLNQIVDVVKCLNIMKTHMRRENIGTIDKMSALNFIYFRLRPFLLSLKFLNCLPSFPPSHSPSFPPLTSLLSPVLVFLFSSSLHHPFGLLVSFPFLSFLSTSIWVHPLYMDFTFDLKV